MSVIKKIIGAILFSLLPLLGVGADFTVVIDPGHGGKDSGAVGTTAKEKDINLGVALKLGKLIEKNCPDVKVVYTRDNDVFIPLQSRADIANKASGDLFISIHTNSIDKSSKNYKTIAGASVYTLGFRRSEENLAVAMRENSVIKLESDYSTVYEGFDPSSTESYIIFEMSRDKHMEQSVEAASALQNELVATAGRKDHGVRQANFWVLFKTSMPAVLVELDFICNPQCEKFMSSEAGQNSLAQSLFNGFRAYKKTDDTRKLSMNGSVTEESKKTRKTQTAGSDNRKTDKDKKKKTESSANKPSKQEEKPDKTTEIQPAPTTSGSGGARQTASDGVVYKIQFYMSSTKLPAGSSKFKGLEDTDFYIDGGVYKYTVGEYPTMEDARKDLPRIKKSFSDAFVIKMQDGKRVK